MTRVKMQVEMFATTKEKLKPEALALNVELWLNSQSMICMGEEWQRSPVSIAQRTARRFRS
ncbi:MAG: hypothetical protein ACYSW3_29795 [Planctomycetota bacterium]